MTQTDVSRSSDSPRWSVSPEQSIVWGAAAFFLAAEGYVVFQVLSKRADLGNPLTLGLVVAPAVMGILALLAVTLGRLGPSPVRTEVDSTGIVFHFASGSARRESWESTSTYVELDDIIAAWDPQHPSRQSHRYYIAARSGGRQVIDEALFQSVISVARQRQLDIGQTSRLVVRGMRRTRYRVRGRLPA